jgi:hypothetical protein
VIILYPSLRVSSFKVKPFNVIYHLRRAAKKAHPFFVALRFVPNADRALGLGKGKREWLQIGQFFLNKKWWREGDPESVPSGHFAATAKRKRKAGQVDPALNNLLWGETSYKVRNLVAVEFKVALMTTIHSDNYDSIRTSRYLIPTTKPQYYDASFFT